MHGRSPIDLPDVPRLDENRFDEAPSEDGRRDRLPHGGDFASADLRHRPPAQARPAVSD
jgi:hypothetical protein